jgi:hypothetical protein
MFMVINYLIIEYSYTYYIYNDTYQPAKTLPFIMAIKHQKHRRNLNLSQFVQPDLISPLKQQNRLDYLISTGFTIS